MGEYETGASGIEGRIAGRRATSASWLLVIGTSGGRPESGNPRILVTVEGAGEPAGAALIGTSLGSGASKAASIVPPTIAMMVATTIKNTRDDAPTLFLTLIAPLTASAKYGRSLRPLPDHHPW